MNIYENIRNNLNEKEAPQNYERGNAPFESKRVPEDRIREEGYQYFSTHGVGPGTHPRDVRVRELDIELPSGWVTFKTDRPLTSEELDWYDIQPETKNSYYRKRFGLEDYRASLKKESENLNEAIEQKYRKSNERYNELLRNIKKYTGSYDYLYGGSVSTECYGYPVTVKYFYYNRPYAGFGYNLVVNVLTPMDSMAGGEIQEAIENAFEDNAKSPLSNSEIKEKILQTVKEVDAQNNLSEANLEPQYSTRKSFYGKANINDDNTLVSYGTPIMRIVDGKIEMLCRPEHLTQTTIRHIREFMQQNGMDPIPKNKLVKMIEEQGNIKESENTDKKFHTVYVVGDWDDADTDAKEVAESLKKEYSNINVEYKPILEDGIWCVDIIGPYDEVYKLASTWEPLAEYPDENGGYYVEPYNESEEKSPKQNKIPRNKLVKMIEEQGNIKESEEAVSNITYLFDRYNWEIDVDSKEHLGRDYNYHTLLTSVDDAEKFNYHSDYWGDASDYENNMVNLVSDFEPYIGKKIQIDYDDGESEEFTLLGVLVDNQYNDLSHAKILVDDLHMNESDGNNTPKQNKIPRNWKKISGEMVGNSSGGKAGDKFEITKDEYDRPIMKYENGKEYQANWSMIRSPEMVKITNVELKESTGKSPIRIALEKLVDTNYINNFDINNIGDDITEITISYPVQDIESTDRVIYVDEDSVAALYDGLQHSINTLADDFQGALQDENDFYGYDSAEELDDRIKAEKFVLTNIAEEINLIADESEMLAESENLKESSNIIWSSETTEDDYDPEELKERYQEYKEEKDEAGEDAEVFEDWKYNYIADDSYDQWDLKKDDLENNIYPMIDKQINNDILIVSGNYNSNYPDFRPSGKGGKFLNKAEDILDWLSNEDRIDFTNTDGIVGVNAYDHDGSIGGLLYTLPDDDKLLLEIAKATDYYEVDATDDEILDEFKYDLTNGNIDMSNLKGYEDRFIPITVSW